MWVGHFRLPRFRSFEGRLHNQVKNILAFGTPAAASEGAGEYLYSTFNHTGHRWRVHNNSPRLARIGWLISLMNGGGARTRFRPVGRRFNLGLA
jgi:hypothetical protein